MTILFLLTDQNLGGSLFKKTNYCAWKIRWQKFFPNVIKINNYNEIFDSTKKLINKDLNSNDYEIELINYIAASMDVSFLKNLQDMKKNLKNY